MFRKGGEETGAVKTLKPARGSTSMASLPYSKSSPETGTSSDPSNTLRSPNSGAKQEGKQLLGSVGIVELLEQDERPTFVIDVANPLNFSPGSPLQIIYANASIRASEPILEMVTGEPDLNLPTIAVTNDFPEFKAWALSYVKNYESLDIYMPSFQYGGITWACATLRKRLRVISGIGSNIPSAGGSSPSHEAPKRSSTSSARLRGPSVTNLKSPLNQSYGPSDYFGDVAAHVNSVDVLRKAAPSGTAALITQSPSEQVTQSSHGDAFTSDIINRQYAAGSSSLDWTRVPTSAALPKHIQFIKSIDWEATALGPMENWSYDLRAMCNLIMASPHPAAIYWGEDHIILYNEAYISLAGLRHPKLMGMIYKTGWPEIWDELEEVFMNAKKYGKATMRDHDLLFLRRNGFLEECYFSWSIIPLVGQDGSVVGLYNPAFEKTRRTIAERRMLTLREVGEKTAAARDLKGFWGQVIKGLEYNEHDVPFAFLYSVIDDVDSDLSSVNSGPSATAPQCILEGTLGVPPGHRAAISPLDLKTGEDGFAPYLRESLRTDTTVLLTAEEGTLPPELIQNLQNRGFGDSCRAALVCPIHPTTGDSILGFLVMGINPMRPYDDDYSLFIQLLSRQLATSMASVVLFEEEIRRGERAARLAALDRQELEKLLDIRTQEAVESETKFQRMAEFAPVGMFIANKEGDITYSNNYLEMVILRGAESVPNNWMKLIKGEDMEDVFKVWDKLLTEKVNVTHEFRFEIPFRDPHGNDADTWALMSAFPEREDDGGLKSVFGSITNISQQKWAENFQKRRIEEAIRVKQSQEQFIDMCSHEMRNPLSAILQCADQIATTLTDFQSTTMDFTSTHRVAEIVQSNIEAAEVISLCAQHQKRIVDDILTLSKLDSTRIIITPVAVQPVAVVEQALKMFEGELETHDIAMDFRIEKSYLDLAVDYVRLDPSRLLQVLINLTTNAIKFTQPNENRTIIVSVGASMERPRSSDSGVCYFPTRSERKDLTTDKAEWGHGEVLYLHFAVQDTGRGLTEKEKTLLFQRFSQASPRTHVQYGGSGLGLFISRELTELQGGEIGVLSEKGEGSTFAFYVKTRRADHIPNDSPVMESVNAHRRDSSNSATLMDKKTDSSGAILLSNIVAKSSKRRSAHIPPISPTPSRKSSLDFSKVTVLIVEDNLVNQNVLRKQLRHVGFVTEVANHGGEALDFLKRSRFWTGREEGGVELSVILMDWEMPIMDGLTCTRNIRDLEADGTIVKHVPIIGVTANARTEQIETAMSAGMDSVVSKPFRIPELIPKIEQLLATSQEALSSSSSAVALGAATTTSS